VSYKAAVIRHNWNPFLRFPRASLLATALLCVPLLLRLAGFQVTSETRVLLEGDQRNLSSYEKVKQILANVEVVVISMECPEVFSPQGIDAVRRVSEAFEKLPDVEDVKSLTHSYKPVRRGFSFEMVPLVPKEPMAPPDLEKLKLLSLGHPLIRNLMVAGDSRHTIILVTYRRSLTTVESQKTIRKEVEATLAPFRQETLRFQVLGLPLIEEEIRSSLKWDIQRFVPAAFVLLLIILWWTFRSFRILALAVVNQFCVLLVLPGVIDWGGFALNLFSVMLFPLLTGIHLAQLAHVYGAFHDAWLSGQDTDEAIRTTLDTGFKSCLFSLVTTAIGLLSLATSGVREIQEFGLLGAVGVGIIFFMTFGPGLALLKIVFRNKSIPQSAVENAALVSAGYQPVPSGDSPDGIPGAPGTHHDARFAAATSTILAGRSPTEAGDSPAPTISWSEWITRFVQGYRRPILGLAVLAVVINWIGVGLVRTDIRAVEFLSPRSATRQAVEELDKVYGGINVVQIEIDSSVENGINQLAFLKYVEKLQHYAETRTGVSAAYSYAQLLAMMNQIWEGEKVESLRLPDSSLLVNLFVLALKSQNYPFLTALSDKSFRTAYLVVRTSDMPSERYLAVIEDIVEFAQRIKPANAQVSAAQGIHSILEADRRIIRGQVNSAGLTSIVIGLVLTVLWRSPFLALLSFITNAIPVAFVVAVAGFAGVPLNSITIMVAAICLGIAVDDSIHFITHWRDERRQGMPVREAVLNTFRWKGRPIIFTSVILIAIFSVFWFSSFPPVVHFGLLSAIAFVVALLSVLFLLPAMLFLFGSRKTPPNSGAIPTAENSQQS
jgi:predicted RND superfamily exporter protein